MSVSRSNVICWHDFTEGSGTTVADSGDNEIDMTLVSTPSWTTGGPTNLPDGVDFVRTSSDTGTLSDNAAFDEATTMSIAMWVKPTTLSNIGYMFNRFVNTTATNRHFTFTNFRDSGGTDFTGPGFRWGNGSTTGAVWGTASSWSSGTLYLLVATYNAGTAKIYINGSLDNTDTAGPNTILTGSTDIKAASRGTIGDYFDGKIYQMAYFDKELSLADVENLYNGGDGKTYNDFFSINTGLIRYYNLDSDATDSTGNFDGTLISSPSSVTGKIDNGYLFNGSTQAVELDDSADYDTQNFSCSFWFKTTATVHSGVIGKWYDGSTRQWYFRINQQTGVGVNSGYMEFVVGDASTSTVCAYDTGAGGCNDGNWHHIVVTTDGSDMRMYYDGVLVKTQAYTLTIGYNSAKMQIGRIQNTGTPTYVYFAGTIDEVGFWNRTLELREVRKLYNNDDGYQYPFTFDTRNIVAWYDFTDGSGASLTDASGNQSAGTIRNSPTWGTAGVPSGLNGWIDFDGSNQDVDLSATTLVGSTGDMTMFIWFATDAWESSVTHVVSSNSADGRFTIRLDGTDLEAFAIDSVTAQVATELNASLPAVTTWVAVASISTFGGTQRLWRDGLTKDSTALGATPATTTGGWHLASNTGDNRYYDGKIAQLILFDRGLTDAELAELYVNGVGISYADFIGGGGGGYANDVNTVESANIGKINTVATANISKVNGS